jgi:hypothetical protein
VPLLTDADLKDLFTRAHAVSKAWLARANAGLAPELAGRTLTLDFEFRRVHPGWPALATGELRPERTVLKQARSLEPSARRLTPEQQALPFPRDVLARAAHLRKVHCQSARFSADALQALTDPTLLPDLGHATAPFTGQLTLRFTQDVPELQRVAGEAVVLGHLDLTGGPRATTEPGAPWTLTATVREPGASGLDEVQLAQTGAFLLRAGAQSVSGADLSCRFDELFSSAREYLESLL